MDVEYEILPPSTIETQSTIAQRKALEEIELRKKAETIPAPTNDEQVKAKLIEIGEPIIYFAETKAERRWRLRMALARRGDAGIILSTEPKEEVQREQHRPYSTDGPSSLKDFRLWILNDSIQRAKSRVSYLKKHIHDEDINLEKSIENLKKFTTTVSVVGDDRALTSVSVCTNGKLLATSSWTGKSKLWNVETYEEIMTFRGHEDRVNSILFHPFSGVSLSNSVANIATGAADNKIKLWSLDKPTCISTLEGHLARVNGLDFHPSGKYLASTSHDSNWNLWDLEKESLILSQDGHSKPTYCVRFHPDGGLVATAALDAAGRVWDIRSGKPIYTLKGHVNQVLGIDWHPHGSLLATGSHDHTCSIWDLRMRKQIYTILAHNALISHVKFTPIEGRFLVTCGYDSKIKIWNSEDWTIVKELIGHEQKVTHFDFVCEENDKSMIKSISSTSFDRTWKLWTNEEFL